VHDRILVQNLLNIFVFVFNDLVLRLNFPVVSLFVVIVV